MDQPAAVYQTGIQCPVCDKTFEMTKIRSKLIRLQKQDTDFCPYYEGINPLFYEAVVCPHCGFASHVTSIEIINKYEKQKVKDLISKKWITRNFNGERTWEKALEAFKLVLLNLNCREAAQSEIAKICLRIAWLYRYAGDNELEQRYLSHALSSYEKAYQGEDLTGCKLDEFTCLFIIGELSKRTGDPEESLKWFSKLFAMNSDPKNKSKIPQKLIESARDSIQELKKQTNKPEAI